MKANYLLKNRRGHPLLKRFAALAAILICGAFAFSLLEEPIVSVVSPVWKAENFFMKGVREKFALVSSQSALVNENSELKDRLEILESELAIVRQASERAISEADIFTAAVLARPPQSPYDILIVDIGGRASLVSGSKVFLPEGQPIGTVFEILGRQAKVKLFSTVEETTNAVLERHNVPVVLVGAGGGNFKIVLPRDVSVEKGDRILTADDSFQLLAVVEDITTRPTDSFKEVLAKTPANIFSLRFVLITP